MYLPLGIFACLFLTAFAHTDEKLNSLLKRLESALQKRNPFPSERRQQKQIETTAEVPEGQNFRENTFYLRHNKPIKDYLNRRNPDSRHVAPAENLHRRHPDNRHSIPPAEYLHSRHPDTRHDIPPSEYLHRRHPVNQYDTEVKRQGPYRRISYSEEYLDERHGPNRNQNYDEVDARQEKVGSNKSDEVDALDKDYMKYEEFRCPTLKNVLIDLFQGFPQITDMSWNMSVNMSAFRPIAGRAIRTYKVSGNGRLAFLQLTQNLANYVITKRMVCPATKFQQLTTYLMKLGLEDAFRNSSDSLFNRLSETFKFWEKQIPYNEQFIRSSIDSVHSEIYGEIVPKIQVREFPYLRGILESIYMKGMEHLIKTGKFPSERDLFQMFNNTVVINSQAFRCTPAKDLYENQRQIFRQFLKEYDNKMFTYELSKEFISILQELFRNHYPSQILNTNVEYQMTLEFDQYIEGIIDGIREYLNVIGNGSTSARAMLFKDMLDENQLKIAMKIEASLNGYAGLNTTSCPPTSCPPNPTTNEWISQVQSVIDRLRKMPNSNETDIATSIQELQNIIDKSQD
ncbi:uncharacterized protein LOC127733173 [Mytilus californianus]|uniref:uncharacterized protein LOC127733173 n=1 Tax=Mytilus californianus TaxID=6549 RepID=UPI002246945C|nr:uncharacterized protein LOC127733173 [Mytilus californianus]